MRAFVIEAEEADGAYRLMCSTRQHDGGIYNAVVRTPYGFVIGSSISKEIEGEMASTRLQFMFKGREFSTWIEGKQYKPQGMVSLAREFVEQCVKA